MKYMIEELLEDYIHAENSLRYCVEVNPVEWSWSLP